MNIGNVSGDESSLHRPEPLANDASVPHPADTQNAAIASRLNWLRAGVLGANDGIVSLAGLVVGVAGASAAQSTILTAGVAGLVAGAVSMALGEYVSVSSQRDTEAALLAQERRELAETPELELAELAGIYRAKGLTEETARKVAEELTDHGAFRAHAEAELGINPGALTNPWNAAISSAISFSIGAAFPLVAILVSPISLRVPITFLVVLLALALTGDVSARLGSAGRGRAVVRVVLGGALAMLVTYGIGHLLGAAGV